MRRYKGMRPENARDLVTLGLIVAVVLLLAAFFMRSCGAELGLFVDPYAVRAYNDT